MREPFERIARLMDGGFFVAIVFIVGGLGLWLVHERKVRRLRGGGRSAMPRIRSGSDDVGAGRRRKGLRGSSSPRA